MIQEIMENVYMQYFIRLHEFTLKPSFSATSMVYFRKRLTAEIVSEINEMIFSPEKRDDD